MTTKHAFSCALSLVLAATALAETLPFWGDVLPATNRTCASTATVALSPAFNSRGAFTARAALAEFTSNRLGLLMILR
jgi:hypothetical protein